MSRSVAKLSTGIIGLDEILQGGLVPHRSYLITGGPGSGKTTLGLHYLGKETGNGSLFVSLGETEAQLRSNAETSGLCMDGVEVLDLSPGGQEELVRLRIACRILH